MTRQNKNAPASMRVPAHRPQSPHLAALARCALAVSLAWAHAAPAATMGLDPPGDSSLVDLLLQPATAAAVDTLSGLPALPEPSRLQVSSTPAAVPQAESATLGRLLEQVLGRDPQVQSSRALLQAARAQQAQTRLAYLPRGGLSAQVGQNSAEEGGEIVNRKSSRSEASLRWNLFNGLADQAQIEASQNDVAAAALDLRRSQEEAAEGLAEAYLDALRLDGLIEQSAWRLVEVVRLVRFVQRQAAAGKASESDAEFADSSLIDARVSHDLLRADRAAAQARLEALVGAAVGPLSAVEPAAAVELPQDLDELWLRARGGNARWRAAEERAVGARVRLGKVAPELLPKLDLDMRHQLSDKTTPAVSTQQRRSWSLNLSYDLPFGANDPRPRRDEGLQRAQAALAEADRVGQTLRVELGNAQQRYSSAFRAAPLLRRQAEHLGNVLRAGEVQYEAGRRSLTQLIDMRVNRFQVEQKIADNRLKLQLAKLRHLALMGELLPVLGVSPEPAP